MVCTGSVAHIWSQLISNITYLKAALRTMVHTNLIHFFFFNHHSVQALSTFPVFSICTIEQNVDTWLPQAHASLLPPGWKHRIVYNVTNPQSHIPKLRGKLSQMSGGSTSTRVWLVRCPQSFGHIVFNRNCSIHHSYTLCTLHLPPFSTAYVYGMRSMA